MLGNHLNSQWAIYAVAAVLFAAVIVALLYIRRRKNYAQRFLTTMRLSVLDRTVQKACRYIEGRFSDPALSVNDVCRELVTGESYLNTLFVNELGVNVRDFITQVRINGIKFFIAEDPDQDVATVCAQCGFASAAEAEAQFARVCGTGIGEYVTAVKNSLG